MIKKQYLCTLKMVEKQLKYLFCVSSHLGFSICNHLIQVDGLNASDCVFLATRNYQLPAHSPAYDAIETELNSSATSGRLFAGWRICRTYKNLRWLDDLIKAHVGESDFYYYTQGCDNDLCSAFVTNPQCKGYYIIEDGSGSYRKEEIYAFTGWKSLFVKCILRPLFPRIFTLKAKMIEVEHPKFRGCIATNPMCFPMHKDVTRVIGLPFQPIPLDVAPQAMISLDPYYRWITDEQVQHVLKQLAAFINTKQYKRIVYKPHPYLLTIENRARYLSYNKWIHEYIDADLVELGADVSLENTLMAHPDCEFYTAFSSVAIYAKAMGIHCYTFAPLLRQYCTLSVPIVEEMCTPINPD